MLKKMPRVMRMLYPTCIGSLPNAPWPAQRWLLLTGVWLSHARDFAHALSSSFPIPPLFPPVWLQVGLPDKPRFSSVPMTHQWLRDNEAALNNAFEVFSEAYQVLQQVRGEGKMG